ncbi:MAG: hypothetical protein H6Q15_507 [Bacteroidetes bacterium]|nr:hypothetical protein [Bacteroidota bacterium]
MKKIIFTLIILLVSISVKAQDTGFVYIPPQLNGCTYWSNTPSSTYGSTDCLNGQIVYHPAEISYVPGLRMDFYAQPYHMDSIVDVIGICAKMISSGLYYPGNYFKITDMSFNTLDSVPYIAPSQMTLCKFYFQDTVKVKDFYIMITYADTVIFNGNNTGFDYTLTGFDSINCVYTACNTGYDPWVSINGIRSSFSEHPAYKWYKNVHLAFFPILKVKNSSLSSVDLEKYTYVYPNPAKDDINFSCSFMIKDIEIYDIMGKRVLKTEVKDYSKSIDISSLAKGSYVAKLNTEQGLVSKKFIVE